MARAAVAWGMGVRVRRRNWIAAVLAVLFVVVMPSVVAWLIWQGLPAPKDVSVFAEAFGNIVGPLFAALAFAGLIYTALMQREELSLQRQELKETREELKRTADAQEASEAALSEQVRIAQLSARLNAAIALLDLYDFQTSKLPSSYPTGSEYERKHKEIRANREDMQNELFRVRNELIGAVQGVGAATGAPGTASGSGEAGN